MSEVLSRAIEPVAHPAGDKGPNYRLPAMLAIALVHPLVHGLLYAFCGLVAYGFAQVFGTGFERLSLADLLLAGIMIVGGFYMVSGPPVLLATALGFCWLRHRPEVRLSHILIGTALLSVPCFATYLMVITTWNAPAEAGKLGGLLGSLVAAPLVALPGTLIASYVTWHVTRRWHAPGAAR